MIGLASYGSFPGDAEPGEIFHQGILEASLASRGIDVFDPKQETTSLVLCDLMSFQGRKSVAAVEQSGGAWSETGDERRRHADGGRLGNEKKSGIFETVVESVGCRNHKCSESQFFRGCIVARG